MEAIVTKARELTEAIRRRQEMLHKFWPRCAIQTQEELIHRKYSFTKTR